MPALRYWRGVLDVEVDGADLRSQTKGVEDAHGQPVARIGQLCRVHREAPAGIQAVQKKRERLLNIRARIAVLRNTDEVAVDENLDGCDARSLICRPSGERHVAFDVVELDGDVDKARSRGDAILGALEEHRDALRSWELRECLLLIADAHLQHVISRRNA